MLKVKFKLLTSTAKLPVKGSLHAACYDVYADSIERDEYGVATYKLGFSTEIPEGWKGIIVPRSNLTKQRWVMLNSPGQVDPDYRGEWMVKLYSLSGVYAPHPYQIGDRVAQIYFERVEEVEFEQVDELSDTQRDAGGFGSTGLK